MRIRSRSVFVAACVGVVGFGLLIRNRVVRAKENSSAGSALTIYNQQFAVVRQMVPLEFKAGMNLWT